MARPIGRSSSGADPLDAALSLDGPGGFAPMPIGDRRMRGDVKVDVGDFFDQHR